MYFSSQNEWKKRQDSIERVFSSLFCPELNDVF